MSFQNNELEIVVWDVHICSSTYIKTPTHKDFLIDLGMGNFGMSNKKFSPINHIRENYNVGKFDLVIISHPDADHLYDILNLPFNILETLLVPKTIRDEEIKEKIQNSTNETHKAVFQRYLELCQYFSNSVDYSKSYRNPVNNGGVKIENFFPKPDISTNRINNHSIVTVVSYASVKILLPGDNELSSWKFLLDDKNFIETIKDVDVFIASHHGRESGYYDNLFQYFTPKLVVISDGPEGETSVTYKYSKHSSGWKVQHRNGKGSEERKCLTTRNDGVIVLKIGNNGVNPYLSVSIA